LISTFETPEDYLREVCILVIMLILYLRKKPDDLTVSLKKETSVAG